MADLSPDIGARLGRLLPRLASDAPGEVVATVAAIRRTLDRAGMDLHDLAARLTDPPRLVQPPPPKRKRHAQREGPDLLAMAQWLHARALDRLTHRQADFVATADYGGSPALDAQDEKAILQVFKDLKFYIEKAPAQ